MNLKLYITKLPTETATDPLLQRLVETYPEEGFTLREELPHVGDIVATNAAFTKTFNIPATPGNQKIFEFIHINGNESAPDPFKAIEATIIVNENLQIEGTVEVTAFSYVGDQIAQYTIVFYANRSTLLHVFGQDELPDIDFSRFDFLYSYANIRASWALGGSNYFVPIIGHNVNYNYVTGAGLPFIAGNIADNRSGVLLQDLKPSYELKEYCEAIFENYGLNLFFSSKINAHLNELFLLPSRQVGGVDNGNINQLQYITVTSGGGTVFGGATLLLMQATQDPNGNWTYTAGVDAYYTAYASGSYTFEMFVELTGRNQISFGYSINAGATVWFDSSNNVFAFLSDFTVTLTAGDVVRFFIRKDTAGTATTLSEEMRTTDYPFSIIGQTLEASPLMPDIKVSDFLNNLMIVFNASLIELTPGNWYMLDLESLVDFADAYDISQYADRANVPVKKVVLPRRVIYRHEQNDDFTSFIYESESGRKYGQIDFRFDREYGEKEETLESIFAVVPPAFYAEQDSTGNIIGNTDLLANNRFDENDKAVFNKLMLIYRNGPEEVNYQYYLQDVYIGTTPNFILQTEWPYFSSNQDLVSEAGTRTIVFGYENPAFGQVAGSNIFAIFHKDTLTALSQSFWQHSFDAILPDNLLNDIKVYDILVIDGESFIIDEYKLNFTKGKSNLLLRALNEVPFDTTPDTVEFFGNLVVINGGTGTALQRATVGATLNNGRAERLNPKPAALASDRAVLMANLVMPKLRCYGGAFAQANSLTFVNINLPALTYDIQDRISIVGNQIQFQEDGFYLIEGGFEATPPSPAREYSLQVITTGGKFFETAKAQTTAENFRMNLSGGLVIAAATDSITVNFKTNNAAGNINFLNIWLAITKIL